MNSAFLSVSYLLSGVLFILAIRGLASPQTARRGNILGMLGMAVAVTATLMLPEIKDIFWILLMLLGGGLVGIFSALKVRMTALPQMVAAFNGLGGLAAVFISAAEIAAGSPAHLEASLGMLIGAVAFSGSLIAFAKLQGIMPPKAIVFAGQQGINLFFVLAIIGVTAAYTINGDIELFEILVCLSIVLGLLLILPIGGADMPVVISVLNAYSGWAAVGIGFSLNNVLMIIVGAIVGASGAILSYIMTKAMNRSLLSVMLGGFGLEKTEDRQQNSRDRKVAKAGNPQDAAFIMENANKVIIVPGYGMAVAQAQHVLKEMADDLRKDGVEVKYAIHPVAGRMPGHMNVLLAEANVPYEDVYELEEINREFASADVAYVIGANDVTNPLAKTDPNSPIYGMPVLEVEKARTVFFVKRSLGTGYSGVENPLFFADNTIMLYGDAKKVTEEIVSALEQK
ncbi:MAG: NAD(P)(+) transhydrogenase (Re/Si-specific) subunit beta [Alphaproteobacteria bacterium]|nr:NAD(P)(+) transhydrogenase (Re/Si-specific) subunit beta [Alphaproteobacteria bacterium]